MDEESSEGLRSESKELAKALSDVQLDSLAGVKKLGGYVARLALLLDRVVERLEAQGPSNVVRAATTARRPLPAKPSPPATPMFPGERALVVDDDLASRRLMTRVLERQGFKCNSAASVGEARGLLEDEEYALLVTDMRMWGEEGLDLVRFATDEYPDVAVIMVSGMEATDLAQKAVQAGASFYIQKPIELDDFAQKVKVALEAREEAIKLRKHRGE